MKLGVVRKLRVVEADVDGDNVEIYGLRSVGFKRRRDGETSSGVTVEDVDEFLLFDGADHDGAALDVSGKVLTRRDAADASLAERFALKHNKLTLSLVEFKY